MQWPVLMAESGGESEGSGGNGEAAAVSSEGQSGQTMLSGEGTSLLDWRQGFPEDLRTSATLQRFTSSEQAARALVEQDHALGRAVFLPDRRKAPVGSDEYLSGLQKVQAKLREYDPVLAPPEKADEYEWDAPEGRVMTEEASHFWREVFHKAGGTGITTGAAKDIMTAFWQKAQQAENQFAGRSQESYQEGRNALFREFGADTEREMKLFEGFVRHFGAGAFSGEAGQKFLEQLQEATLADGSRLANSPYMVATFANAMRKLGEGEYLESPEYQVGANTEETLRTRHKELTAKQFASEGLTTDEARELRGLAERLTRRQRSAA